MCEGELAAAMEVPGSREGGFGATTAPLGDVEGEALSLRLGEGVYEVLGPTLSRALGLGEGESEGLASKPGLDAVVDGGTELVPLITFVRAPAVGVALRATSVVLDERGAGLASAELVGAGTTPVAVVEGEATTEGVEEGVEGKLLLVADGDSEGEAAGEVAGVAVASATGAVRLAAASNSSRSPAQRSRDSAMLLV